MSSFKRTIKTTSSILSSDSTEKQAENINELSIPISGIKPWIHNNLGIISSGNKQLDDLIGGGIVLGTLTCIEIDHLTTYGDSLINYYLIESISHQHNTLIINENEKSISKIIGSLPYNRTIGSENSNNLDSSINKSTPLYTWKDGKYMDVQIEHELDRNDLSNPIYCCSYDLSRRIQSNLLQGVHIELCSLERHKQIEGTINQREEDNIFSYILKTMEEFLLKCTNKNKKAVNRIYLPLDQIISQYLLENQSNNIHNTSTSIARFLLQIKHMIRETRTSVLITIKPQLVTSYIIIKLRYISDNLLTIESFAGRTHSIPYEFKDFHGFLVIHKLQNYGTLASFRPSGTRFGLKRNRYKLNIEPLHLPPEENRTFAGTGGNSAIAGVDTHKQIAIVNNDSRSRSQHIHNHQNTTNNHLATNSNQPNQDSLSDIISKTKLSETEAMNAIMKIDLSSNDISTNPYKLSLAEKLAAIKAARVNNTYTTVNDLNNASPPPLSLISSTGLTISKPNNTTSQSGSICGSQKYDF